MSPRKSRSLWCLVEGDPKPYDVFDIPIGANVTRLKAMIKQRIERLHDANPDDLKLLKLNMMFPIGPDHSLAQRLAELDNIDAYLTELSSEEKVGELFPEPPSEKHLHIVVRRPGIAPSSPSASRKRSLSATEEDGQAAKRKNIGGNARDIQIRCIAIHKAIQDMPDNLDLSNPSTFKDLPCPSPLLMPPQRFESKGINGIEHFTYMGRSQFHELQERIKDKNFQKGAESIYLYGTSGSGKSHLLAALVYRLVREGQRVFYIPDCSSLLLDPAVKMWDAYHFAYNDSPDLRTTESVDALIYSMSNDPDVYIIVDQMNALDVKENDSRRAKKVQVLNWLDDLRSDHRYIFSASANKNSNREAYKKQNGISAIPKFGGMNPDETKQWFIHHRDQIPHLSHEQRQRVEYLTGCIPLLLRCLIKLIDFDELKFRNISDLDNVKSDVDTFARTKFASLDPLSKKSYLKIMSACVQGGRVTRNDRNLYDLRHFYVDAERIGRFTCGIAFEAMMSILREYDDAPFLDQLWYNAVEQSGNPVVRGFLAKQICLSYIAANGLMAVHPNLGQMSTTSFEGEPDFAELLLTSSQTIRLYIPSAYNFMTVDGVILLLDRKPKKATIFPIQFKLSENHKQLDQEFHMKLWSKWIKPIVEAEYSVDSTFVWIGNKQPSKHQVVKALRSSDKVVHPEYSVVHVGVETVPKKLASALGIQ